MLQTYVLKFAVAAPTVLVDYGKGRLVLGAGAFAVIDVVADEGSGLYFVLTAEREYESTSYAARLRKEIAQLPGLHVLEWIQPLTSRLQRLLGWDDATWGHEGRPHEAAGLQDQETTLALQGHEPAPFAPSARWQQHPTRPLPFYVVQQRKVSNKEKLVSLRQELGRDAELGDFARKFLELFGESVHTPCQQKALVLKIFAEYTPEDSPARGWKKESDVPPANLVEFQRVWNPDAPARCHECGKALAGKCPIPRTHCSEACRLAGMRTACARCKRALDDPVHPCCPVCKLGSTPLPARPTLPARKRNPGEPDTPGERLDRRPAERRAMLGMAQRVWFSDQQKDPNWEPAWKRRRRS